MSVAPAAGQPGDTLLAPPAGREILHRLELTKPDGRALTLYGLEPIDVEGPAPSPGATAKPPAGCRRYPTSWKPTCPRPSAHVRARC